MKINKTLIIISLLLIFCISLGAVSAADNAEMSVNDINNEDVATVESSVMNEEISTVSDGEIHNSSEIANNISRARGTYNITNDYQINKTWEIPNDNVIIEGNNHTIYGNGKQAFNIQSNNVIIKNLNFINCSSNGRGGAIYFDRSGSVVNCSFVGCSADRYGVAIYFYNNGVVYYCVFDNNKAQYNAIHYRNRSSSLIVDYNFFGFQNNVTTFPNSLINIKPKNWVVLKGYASGDKYIANFVLNDGSALDEFMPDYTARLVVGSEEKIITIHNNTFSCEYDSTKSYNVYSLNTGELLTSLPSNSVKGSDPVFKPKVILTVEDIKGISGSTVKVDVGVNNLLGMPINEGTVTISLNGKEYKAKVIDGIATFNIVIPSKEGIYSVNVLFNDKGTGYDNTTCNFTVTSILEDNTNNTEDINKSVVSNKINNVTNIENCGTPLIALLIALICLPLIRRK